MRWRVLVAVALVALCSSSLGSTAKRRPIAVGDAFTPSIQFEDFELNAAGNCAVETTIGTTSGTVSVDCDAAGLAGGDSAEWSEARQAFAADTGDMRTDPTSVTDQTSGTIQVRFLLQIDTLSGTGTNVAFVRGYLNGTQTGLRVFFNDATDKVTLNCISAAGSDLGSALTTGTLYYFLIVYDITNNDGTMYVNTTGYSKTNAYSVCDSAAAATGMDQFRFYRADMDLFRIDNFGWGPDA